jgi:hypothetical protein
VWIKISELTLLNHRDHNRRKLQSTSYPGSFLVPRLFSSYLNWSTWKNLPVLVRVTLSLTRQDWIQLFMLKIHCEIHCVIHCVIFCSKLFDVLFHYLFNYTTATVAINQSDAFNLTRLTNQMRVSLSEVVEVKSEPLYSPNDFVIIRH